mgnify:CR=1 FL=1
MRKILFFIYLIYPILLQSQIVKVYNYNTLERIFNFQAISNINKKQITTSKKGELKLNLSNPSEKFSFSSVGFETIVLSSKEIISQKNSIYLPSLSESLDEVVISNTKWKQLKRQISKKVISIQKEDIFLTQPQTTADAIAKTGSVFVQKSQQGGGSPIIRGFSTNRLLISVDGVRMNTAIFRSGNLQNIISIDPLSLESSEVILGPGSIIYGSDAIGGTLNFKTLSPKLVSENENKIVTGNIFYRSSTANFENTVHADVNLSFKKWGTVSSFSFSSFDDLKQGSKGPSSFLRNDYVTTENNIDIVVKNSNPKKQVKSGYDQTNFLQKISYKPSSYWDFGLQFIYSGSSKYDRYDRLQRKKENQFRSAEWFYGPQNWFMTLQTISYNGNSLLTDRFKISSAYQFFEESRNTRDFNSLIKTNNTEKLDVLTFNLDAEKKIRRLRFNYGAEYVTNEVNSTANITNIETKEISNNISTRYPDDSTWKSIGAYAVFNLQINTPFNISGGLRYNHVKLRADFEKPELDFPFVNATADINALTWSLGSTYRLNSEFSIRGNANTAFRAPNIDDIGKIFNDSKPGTLIVPNPNLKSEYAYNFSLSTEYDRNSYKASFTAYHTFLEDALTEDTFNLRGEETILFRGEQSNIFATQNSNSIRIFGFELLGQIPFTSFLKIKGGYTLTKGEETLVGGKEVSVRHVPPSFGNMHFIYHKKKWSLDFFSDFNGGFTFNDLAPSEKLKTDIYAKDKDGNPFLSSWYTVNIRGHYNINSKLRFSGALENITDQRYRLYSSGISAPGINFITAVNYSF